MDRALDREGASVAALGTVARAPIGRARSHAGEGGCRAAVCVAVVSGGASQGRDGAPDAWRPAFAGAPVASGDRLYTARGARLEDRTAGLEVRLSSATGLEAIDLSGAVLRFRVWRGSAAFLVRRARAGESFEVGTPNAAVRFERAAECRIDVDGEGTRVVVGHGSAWVSAAGVSARFGSGSLVRVEGDQPPACDSRPVRRRGSGLREGEAGAAPLRNQVILFALAGSPERAPSGIRGDPLAGSSDPRRPSVMAGELRWGEIRRSRP